MGMKQSVLIPVVQITTTEHADVPGLSSHLASHRCSRALQRWPRPSVGVLTTPLTHSPWESRPCPYLGSTAELTLVAGTQWGTAPGGMSMGEWPCHSSSEVLGAEVVMITQR